MIIHCGRKISSEELVQICETVKTFLRLSRNELVHTVCEHLNWYTASGKNKGEACLKLLQNLGYRHNAGQFDPVMRVLQHRSLMNRCFRRSLVLKGVPA